MTPFSISDAVMKVKAALRGGLLQKRIQLVHTLPYFLYFFRSI